MALNPNVDGSITATAPTEPGRADLVEAFDAIRNKRKALDELFSYYDSPQPLKYTTEKLRELFQNINTHFEENFCSVVVDSVVDRLQLTGFTTPDDDANAKLKEVFDELHLDLEADDAHQASLTTSQAYMIVWKEASGDLVAFYNDPRMCHIFYEDANPKRKRFAAKWFVRADGKQEITLYYTDRLEHWATDKAGSTSVDQVSSFVLENSEPNQYGVIPVFDLKSKGELFKILTRQDAINDLFDDMMTAAKFGAVLQKYVISQADPGTLKNAPNEIWWLPAGDGTGQPASAGFFPAQDLNNFMTQIEKIAYHVAITTNTPKHYFFAQGGDPSGEALIALEAPLNKKSKKHQKRFGAQWQEIAAFIAQLIGVTVNKKDITPTWERVESVQPLTEAQTRQTNTNAGIPIEVQLKWEGKTDAEIAEVKKAKAADKKQQADNLLNRMNVVRTQPAEAGNTVINQ